MGVFESTMNHKENQSFETIKQKGFLMVKGNKDKLLSSIIAKGTRAEISGLVKLSADRLKITGEDPKMVKINLNMVLEYLWKRDENNHIQGPNHPWFGKGVKSKWQKLVDYFDKLEIPSEETDKQKKVTGSKSAKAKSLAKANLGINAPKGIKLVKRMKAVSAKWRKKVLAATKDAKGDLLELRREADKLGDAGADSFAEAYYAMKKAREDRMDQVKKIVNEKHEKIDKKAEVAVDEMVKLSTKDKELIAGEDSELMIP